MKRYFLGLAFLITALQVYAQGCIPMRNIVGFGYFLKPEYDVVTGDPTKWLLNVNTRYFKIAHSYVGSSRTNLPAEDERINETFVVNLAISRIFQSGWSFTVDIPIAANGRTTWQEHDPTNPDKVHRTVNSFGLGDVRVTGYKWIWDPTVTHKGNIQVGIGAKFPTGNYHYKDHFYKATGKILAPVNSTIQLGDGGFGIITEVNSTYTLSDVVSLYLNGFYLINPRSDNGVSSIDGGGTPNPMQLQTGDFVNSVPDAYTARVGANFTLRKFILWAGGRIEGQPTYDLVGESNGTRRAGQIISVEPGVNYRINNTLLYCYVPIPVIKQTQQTVPDKLRSEIQGTYSVSPGGFADYVVFLGVLFKI